MENLDSRHEDTGLGSTLWPWSLLSLSYHWAANTHGTGDQRANVSLTVMSGFTKSVFTELTFLMVQVDLWAKECGLERGEIMCQQSHRLPAELKQHIHSNLHSFGEHVFVKFIHSPNLGCT